MISGTLQSWVKHVVKLLGYAVVLNSLLLSLVLTYKNTVVAITALLVPSVLLYPVLA